MTSWQRSLYGVLTAAGCTVLCAAQSSGQAPPPPDTARARQIVDSLVRAGAYRLPPPETVSVADSTAAAGFAWDTYLHVGSFLAGLLVLAALAIATMYFARRFFGSLDRRSAIGLRTHWGGFGGGDGGWDLTPALSLLVGTVVLAILTAVVASALSAAVPVEVSRTDRQ
jgi:hypothetical protein